MCPLSLMLVTCVVCGRLHEPENPSLTSPVCASCTKPKSRRAGQPR
jgi:hypothetical protein